jgi:hypothetical protein
MKTIEIVTTQTVRNVYILKDIEPSLSKTTLFGAFLNTSEKDLKKYLKRTSITENNVILTREIPYLLRKKTKLV